MTPRVAVVMGGTDSEHEVSLRSGAEVLERLPADRYETLAAVWRRDGLWEIGDDAEAVGPEIALARLRGCDVAFLALHGPGGEDGRIQGFLETAGIPYTGSGIRASAVAMDKAVAKTVARALGIRVAEDAVVRSPRESIGSVAERLGLPCVVKPTNAGSSADLRVVDSEEELRSAVSDLSSRWPALLVESFVTGVEVTGPVLEDPATGAARVLPLVEIRVPGRVFDPEAKYVPGVAEEICPASIDEVAADRVRDATLRIHDALGCRGFSRTDFILRDGEPVYLETNTIPGLTRESLLPKAAREAGMTMGRMLDGLVRCALRGRNP